MLIKLLKHDFRATNRIMTGVFMGAFLIIAAGFIFKMINVGLLTGFYLVAAVIMCIVSVTVPYIVIIWRYYTHLFSREGYLTQTLPISKTKIYLSKLIMSVTWFLCGLLSCVCCLFMIFHISDMSINELFGFAEQNSALQSLIIYIVVVGGIQVFLGIAMILFAITAANIPIFVNSNKLMAVVIYYVSNIIISITDVIAILIFPLGIDLFTGKVVPVTMLSQLLIDSENVTILGFGSAAADLILAAVCIYFTIVLLKRKVVLK